MKKLQKSLGPILGSPKMGFFDLLAPKNPRWRSKLRSKHWSGEAWPPLSVATQALITWWNWSKMSPEERSGGSTTSNLGSFFGGMCRVNKSIDIGDMTFFIHHYINYITEKIEEIEGTYVGPTLTEVILITFKKYPKHSSIFFPDIWILFFDVFQPGNGKGWHRRGQQKLSLPVGFHSFRVVLTKSVYYQNGRCLQPPPTTQES